MPAILENKEVHYGSVSFSLVGIRALIVDLTAIVKEQGEIEIAQTKRREDQTQEEFEEFTTMARKDIFKLLSTVNYSDGSALHTSDPDDIKIEDGGPFIESIYISNRTPYQHHVGNDPSHMFVLFLDFRQPLLLDAATLVSSPTNNETNLQLSGKRPGWRTAIEDAVQKRIKKRRILRKYFHGGFVYDIGLMITGVPFALYCCWYFSDFIQRSFANVSSIVTAGAYLYVGLCAIWIYRILFSYTKWAFPLVELTDQATRPKFHRRVWWGVVTVIAGKLFWDIADPYMSLPLWWQQIQP